VSLRVMDDRTFQLGRHNPQEGGPKGLDLDRSGRVVAVTSELQPLAFFDVAATLARDREPDRHVAAELQRLAAATQARRMIEAGVEATSDAERRAASWEERAVGAEGRAATSEHRAAELEARVAHAEAEARRLASTLEAVAANLAAVEATKTFRATRHLRRAYAAVRAGRRGRGPTSS
jgi:hypothetical protein